MKTLSLRGSSQEEHHKDCLPRGGAVLHLIGQPLRSLWYVHVFGVDLQTHRLTLCCMEKRMQSYHKIKLQESVIDHRPYNKLVSSTEKILSYLLKKMRQVKTKSMDNVAVSPYWYWWGGGGSKGSLQAGVLYGAFSQFTQLLCWLCFPNLTPSTFWVSIYARNLVRNLVVCCWLLGGWLWLGAFFSYQHFWQVPTKKNQYCKNYKIRKRK